MISHHHKTIFVHIPKCGGQSVERMFLEDLGLTWKMRGSLLMRPNDDPEQGPPRLAHLLARDYVGLGHVSRETFDGYFKFAVVRNPYDRALSLFNYLKLSRPRSLQDEGASGDETARPPPGRGLLTLDEFMTEYLPETFSYGDERGQASDFWFVRKQSDYVFDTDGASMLDRVLRLEDLDERIDELRTCCGVQADFRHVNKSIARATRQDLLPRHLDKLEELYESDFELFGYRRHPR